MVELVQEHCSAYGPDPDDEPIDQDIFAEYIGGMTPWEAFIHGVHYVNDYDESDPWVHFDGYGRIESWDEDDYKEWALNYVDEYLAEAILKGDREVPIPREMADILALWVDEDELCVSNNFKTKAKPKQKGRAPSGKAKPKKKAPSRSRPAKATPKKAPVRKTSTRKPTTKRTTVTKRAAPTRKPAKRSREPATKTAYLTGARR